MGEEPALGPSHSLVLCGRGAQLAALSLQSRTLQAAKAHISAKMAAEGARLKAGVVLRAQGQIPVAQGRTGGGCKQMGTGSKA